MSAIDIELLAVPAFVLLLTDTQGFRLEIANAAFGNAFGTVAETSAGRCMFDGLSDEAAGSVESRLRQCVATGEPLAFEEELAGPDGSRWFAISLMPEIDAFTGAARRIVGTSIDITDRVKREKDLERAALTDDLTGLANRRGLTARTEELLQAAAREARGVGVIIVDLDDFKAINDRYGHGVGDEALKEMAGRMCRSLPAAEIIARIGGDEFVAVVRVQGEEELCAIRAALSSALCLPLLLEGRVVHLGASVGGAVWRHGSSLSGLIADADACMYAAKDRRRAA